MKKVIAACIALLCFAAATETAHAWFWDKPKADKAQESAQPQKEEAAKPAAVKTQPQQPATKASEKSKADAEKKAQEARRLKRELVERKRKEIDNRQWSIRLVPLSGKGKQSVDTVVFEDGTVEFKEFGKKGFPATNFSLKIQEDNVAVWETMQTSEKSGVAFWRGEISPDLETMRGVLSHKIDEKTKEDYSFVSVAQGKGAQPAEKK